jgi:hypothetical protein
MSIRVDSSGGNIIGDNFYFFGPTGEFNNLYVITNPITDVSSNSSNTLQILEEISFLVNRIKCENFHGMGTLSDYEELIRLSQMVQGLEINLDLTSLQSITAKAESIKQVFDTLRTTLPTVLNLISMENLIVIRNAFCSILRMLETIENFSFVIRNQYVIRNECIVKQISKKVDKVYKHLDCIFTHDNSQHCIPYYLLENPIPETQNKIDKMIDYSIQMNHFAESLGLELNDSFCEHDFSIDRSDAEI